MHRPNAAAPERFTVSRKRRTALTLRFFANPSGKPLRTVPGIALATGTILSLAAFASPSLACSGSACSGPFVVAQAQTAPLRLDGFRDKTPPQARPSGPRTVARAPRPKAGPIPLPVPVVRAGMTGTDTTPMQADATAEHQRLIESVEVVDPGEVNAIDLAAGPAVEPPAIEAQAEQPAAMPVETTGAAPPSAGEAAAAAPDKPDDGRSIPKMLLALGGAIAAAGAAARLLLVG